MTLCGFYYIYIHCLILIHPSYRNSLFETTSSESVTSGVSLLSLKPIFFPLEQNTMFVLTLMGGRQRQAWIPSDTYCTPGMTLPNPPIPTSLSTS